MLRIGFLPVQKAVPDKPRDTREIGGGQLQLSLLEQRLGPAEPRLDPRLPAAGRPGLHFPPGHQPGTHGHGAAGLGHLWCTQLQEADGVLRAMKWWIWLSGTFYDRVRSWASAKQSRAGIAGGRREQDQQRRGLEDCQAQPPPPAAPGGPSPGPPSARAVLTWKQKIK